MCLQKSYTNKPDDFICQITLHFSFKQPVQFSFVTSSVQNMCNKLQTIILLLWTMLIYPLPQYQGVAKVRGFQQVATVFFQITGPKQQQNPTPTFGDMAQVQPSACMGFSQRFIVEMSKFELQIEAQNVVTPKFSVCEIVKRH